MIEYIVGGAFIVPFLVVAVMFVKMWGKPPP